MGGYFDYIKNQPRNGPSSSQKVAKLFVAQAGLFQNFFQRRHGQITSMHRHNRCSAVFFMPENDMASLLPLLDKTCAL